MDSNFLANFKIADIAFNIFWPILLLVYTWVAGRQKATKTQIDKLTTALATEKEAREKADQRSIDRIRDLENQIKHLPTKDDFQVLKVSMAEVSTRLSANDATLGHINDATNTIHNYLLEKKI